MNKHISHYFMLLGIIFLALMTGLLTQGCSSQANSERGTILGPSDATVQTPVSAESAAHVQPMGNDKLALPVDPSHECDVLGTAEVVFVSRSLTTTLEVTVNGEYQGVLAPQGNMLIRVAEGLIKWQIIDKSTPDATGEMGHLDAKRCQLYTLRVGLSPLVNAKDVVVPGE